jgi:hypothetical protein
MLRLDHSLAGNDTEGYIFLCTSAHVSLGDDCQSDSESESDLLYTWRFFTQQFVLEPSPLRFTTRLSLAKKSLASNSVCNTLFDEWMGLSSINRLRLCHVYLSHIQHVIENSSFCTIYKSSVSTSFVKHIMFSLFILCRNRSLVSWKVASLTAAKFILLIYCMSGFALSCVVNMFILIILCDFCFCLHNYII